MEELTEEKSKKGNKFSWLNSKVSQHEVGEKHVECLEDNKNKDENNNNHRFPLE